MRIFNKRLLFSMASVAVVIFFTGCGAKGPQFSEFKAPSKGNAMLYVYRPSESFGSAASYDVNVSKDGIITNSAIGVLKNGGFLEKELEAQDNLEIWARTEVKRSVFLDLKENETYCVKGTIGFGILVGRPILEIVSKSLCEQEIVKTRESYE